MKKPARALLTLIIALLAAAAWPRPAGAHPLGNFTINHYSALTVRAGAVDLRYILDLAEIPAFQELRDLHDDGSTNLTPAERATYLDRTEQAIRAGLTLTLDGKPLALQTTGRDLSFPPGAGGLPTLRLVLDFTAPLGAGSGTLFYKDTYRAERPGWREIIARAGAGAQLGQATVPAGDRSQALTSYPADLISSPLQVTEATIPFAPGVGGPPPGAAPAPAPATNVGGWLAGRADAMTELMARPDLPLDAILIGLLIAFVLGAGHALSPGHGKAVVAAYLVGSRGTGRHAILLGLTVTVTHTIGVFLFGLIVLAAADFIFPEALYPWLGFVSGMMIVAVGLALVVQRTRALRAGRGRARGPASGRSPAFPLPGRRAAASAPLALAVATAPGAAGGPLGAPLHAHAPIHTAGPIHDHDHDHDHDHAHEHDHDHTHDPDHGHTHEHDHDHGHTHDHNQAEDGVQYQADGTHSHGPWGQPHSHVPPAGQAVSLRSLLALGISGGIIPCPSALVVLLSAIALHRVGLGLLMIVAFSAGLAVVLTGIGLLMVYAGRLLNRLPFNGRALAPLGVLSALAVTAAGLLIALTSLTGAGILRF